MVVQLHRVFERFGRGIALVEVEKQKFSHLLKKDFEIGTGRWVD